MAIDLKSAVVLDPTSYQRGIGSTELSTPSNILFFRRTHRDKLQQENIQNKSHRRVIIIFNLETSGCVHLDNLEIELHPQHALVIPPYQFHHFSNLQQTKINWLICSFEMSSPSFIEPLRNRVIPVSDRTLGCVTNALDIYTNNQDDSFMIDEIQSLLLTTIVRLKQDAVPENAPFAITNNDVVSRVNHLLAEAPNTALSIQHIAESFSLSASRMRAIFSEAAGMSLGQYILNFKIHTAMALLSDTMFSVSEVAQQSGFSSIQAFSRTFKDKIGQSPTRYRRLQSK